MVTIIATQGNVKLELHDGDTLRAFYTVVPDHIPATGDVFVLNIGGGRTVLGTDHDAAVARFGAECAERAYAAAVTAANDTPANRAAAARQAFWNPPGRYNGD